MPSEAGQTLQEQSLDSYARYRSTRHHHGHRVRLRHVRSTPSNVLRSPSLPTPEVARTSVEPFDWKDYQPPIRWTDVDVSAVLKPRDFVNFPPDPAPFELPADPPIVRDYVPSEDWVRRRTFYLFALMIAAILGTGAAWEIGIIKTCHKVRRTRLVELEEQYEKFAPMLKGFQKRPSDLT